VTVTALVTGINGQDGAYLARSLIADGYKVYGAVRRTASADRWRLRDLGIEGDIEYVGLELTDSANIARVLGLLKVDEIYNLAAQSFVSASFDQPLYTAKVNGLAVCEILEAVRLVGHSTKFYQASTSEMFGDATQTPQTETTPFCPKSPYGAAKAFAHAMTVSYRRAFGLFACCGIAFNHESPLRGPEFVSRKATMGLAEIRRGRRQVLRVGNLDARRDWGYADDYVAAMRAMLRRPEANDYVLATGRTRAMRDFIGKAAGYLNFALVWQGRGADEVGIDANTGKTIVEIDPQYYRPLDIACLLGDPAKARQELGWQATTSFDRLVEMMVRADYDRLTDS
jgi:GDPmannose 4,6-dehydratase